MHTHDPFDNDPFDGDRFDHDPFDHGRTHHDPFASGWSSGRRGLHRPSGPVGIAISVVVGLIALGFFFSTASDMRDGPEAPGMSGPADSVYDDPCVVRPGESDDEALDRCVENFDPSDLQPGGFGF